MRTPYNIRETGDNLPSLSDVAGYGMMIHQGRYLSGLSRDLILAHFMMSAGDDDDFLAIPDDLPESADGAKQAPKAPAVMFRPDELDIFINKITLEAYIFHGKKVNYEVIKHLEYNPKDYSVTVVFKDESRLDLGVKIQWLIRPHFAKAENIFIVQTKDGETVDGTTVPLINLGKA